MSPQSARADKERVTLLKTQVFGDLNEGMGMVVCMFSREGERQTGRERERETETE